MPTPTNPERDVSRSGGTDRPAQRPETLSGGDYSRTEAPPETPTTPTASPVAATEATGSWVERAGRWSWNVVGLALFTALVFLVLSALSGIVVPLIVALIVGILTLPLVQALSRFGLPRTLATLCVLLLILVAGVAVTGIVVFGLVQETPVIAESAAEGFDGFSDWVAGLGLAQRIDPQTLDSIRQAVRNVLLELGQGMAGIVSTSITSLAALLVGAFFSLFILFFVLRDGPLVGNWLARHSRVEQSLAGDIIEDVSNSLRGYFRGTAISAAVSSVVVLIGLLIADTPIILAVLLLYFVTSFIPYVGAYIGGAYAVLIAFAGGGIEGAVIVLVAVLISNGSIQSVVTSWAVGSTLNLHPLVILLVTLVGGAIAGILGMVLAAPLTAVITRTVARLQQRQAAAPVPATTAGTSH